MLFLPKTFVGPSRSLLRFWLLCLPLLAGVVACGPGDPGEERSGAAATPDPYPAHWSPVRRATEAFRQTLENIVDEQDLPGAVAAFILPDGRVGAASSGMADLEAGVPMNPETRFLAGSVGKTFVGATVLSLAREGALELDAPVSRYLANEPWFTDLPNGSSMTVRHLLTHTSGLPDHVYDTAFGPALLAQESPAPYLLPRELVVFVLDDEALFPPGEGWAYSDTGYVILGLVIEEVTSRAYAEVLRARLLEPLELARTEPQRRELPRLATGYLAPDNPFGLPERMVEDGALVVDPWVEYTGGGVVSNPQDLVRWAKALYEERALRGPYLEELLGSAVTTDSAGTSSYGLGVSIRETALGRTYGHTGWFPGYRTLMAYYPNLDIAVAFQTNTDVGVDLYAARDALASAVLEGMGLGQ